MIPCACSCLQPVRTWPRACRSCRLACSCCALPVHVPMRATTLAAALLKGDQLPTVVFTAQYFICVDAGASQAGRASAAAAAGVQHVRLRWIQLDWARVAERQACVLAALTRSTPLLAPPPLGSDDGAVPVLSKPAATAGAVAGGAAAPAPSAPPIAAPACTAAAAAATSWAQQRR